MSISTDPVVLFTPQDSTRGKRKSPPNVPFPISCAKCLECSPTFLSADADTKTVSCKQCSHVSDASKYDVYDFTRACLFDRKESSISGGYKRNNETAYLTSVAYVKTQENEATAIRLEEKELEFKATHEERLNAAEERRDATQRELFCWMTNFIPEKSALDKFKERKVQIQQLHASGDISDAMAQSLLEKLNSDLLNAAPI
jgi:hypothetical protein